MPRHAYLVLAHSEFELLKLLIQALDDERNDIFVHIDRKVVSFPSLNTRHAQLYFLEGNERVDVRWGDISVLQAEFNLFHRAYHTGEYSYYHLMSGVDLPLKSQQYIHRFFEEHRGTEFIGFYQGEDLSSQLIRKVQRYHLYPKHFKDKGLVGLIKRVVRAVAIRFQEAFGVYRNRQITFAKGSQWMSITHTLVGELLKSRDVILALYPYTFCSDEIAIQTFVANHSNFRDKVYDLDDEGRSSLRHIGWKGGALYDFELADLETLKHSDALFARKFNSLDMLFIHEVLKLSR